MKKCKKCNKIKKLDNFHRNKNLKDGRYSICKICWNKINREWAHSHYEKVRAKNKRREVFFKDKYGLSLRTLQRFGFETAIKVYERDNKKCKNCGNKNNLVIHHKDHKGRNYLLNGLTQNNSIDNLIVLCASCHGKYHSRKYWKNKKRKIFMLNANEIIINEYNSLREASLKTGISKQNICAVTNGRKKTAGGFIWRY